MRSLLFASLLACASSAFAQTPTPASASASAPPSAQSPTSEPARAQSGAGEREAARVRAARAQAAQSSAPSAAAGSEGAEDEPTYAQLQSVTGFSERLERDARVSFGPRTHAAALREFERLAPSESGQAAALMALGCARVATERARLESYASEGPLALRQAAILALGELRSADIEVLRELATKRAALAEYALFALVRHGAPAARALVEEIASQSAHALQASARDALGFALDPPVESQVAHAFLELRFEAARRFGLVDEQAWTTLLTQDLTRNQRLLSRVVYRAAAELSRAGIKDHYLEVTLAGGVPERLRGVVRAMPTELSRMIDDELFKPLDEREWVTLVDEIEQARLEAVCQPILRRAWFEPQARTAAMELLSKAQAPGALDLVELSARSADPAVRAAAARALAFVPADRSLPMLEALARDEDSAVRAAVLVAQFRLGSESAASELRTTLEIDKTTRWLSEQLAKEQQRAGAGAKPAARGAKREGGEPREGRTKEPRGGEGEPAGAGQGRPAAGADASAERLTPLSREGAQLVEALAAASADRRVRDLLSIARARASDSLRLKVDAELAYHGETRSRVALRERLRDERPRGVDGARAIASLARGYGLGDLELVRELFPLGDDLEVDVELALALIVARDAAVVPLLRAALWSEPWNRSVLAAALLVAQGGIDALRAELTRPPAGVTERDLRRVGFALGEWGGASEVDRLAGRVGAADPALQGALLGALSARTR